MIASSLKGTLRLAVAAALVTGSTAAHASVPHEVPAQEQSAATSAAPVIEHAGFDAIEPVRLNPDLSITAEHRDAADAIVHGRLRAGRVRMTEGSLPPAVAFAALGDAIGIRVVTAFAEDDEEMPVRAIRLDMSRHDGVAYPDGSVPALPLLEALIDEAFGDDGAWQVLGGRLEVGPKRFLARRESRRREFIEFQLLRDLHPGIAEFATDRTRPNETADLRAAEMIRHLTEFEPSAWEPEGAIGQRLRATAEDTNPLARTGRWASISFRQGTFLITAPEFILHRIRGPRGVTPPDLSEPPPGNLEPGNLALRGKRSVADVTLHRYEPSRRDARSNDPALIALGRLWHARLRVVLEGVTVRDAVESIGRATETQIQAFWSDAPDRPGIDPGGVITLSADEISGLEALEMILSLANSTSPPTWQLHGGFVEIGPRAQLARRTAQRTTNYAVEDLQLEPPYFIARRIADTPFPANERYRDIITPLEEQWGFELGMSRPGRTVSFDPATRIAEIVPNRDGGERRKSKEFLAAEMLLDFERHIETDAWLPRDDGAPPARSRVETLQREVLGRQGIWATVQYRNGQMLVQAPDFVHRGIGGYPPLPSPASGGAR